ncbi:UNVERIFIED_CONTAM: hypothetical protein HDU68_001524 [Siphonaria sp. JEL0065]|nr:hypothetical protein HDU68_001524 [Siphonaria sp. JEL0065]
MFMRGAAGGGGNGSGGNTSAGSMKTVDIDETGGGGSGNESFGGSNGGIATVGWDPSVNIGLATVVASAVTANPVTAAVTAPVSSRNSSATPPSPKPSGITNTNIATSIGALFSGKPFSKFSSRKKSLGVCTVSSSMSSNNASQTNLVGGGVASNDGGTTVDQRGLQEAVVQLRELVGKLRTEQYELTRQIQDERRARIKLEKDFLGVQERLRVLEEGSDIGGVVTADRNKERSVDSNSSGSNAVPVTITDVLNSTTHQAALPPSTNARQESNNTTANQS